MTAPQPILITSSKGGTYAGNAVGCAAAGAVIDVMKEENVLDSVNSR